MKLYEVGPSRSVRARWAFLEAGLPFESVAGTELFGSAELKRVHPLGKVPALEVDGRPLFESAAIATYIADQVPERGLVAPSGTWDRALHDQWTAFALTEIEAYLWSSAKNTRFYPEEKRVPAILERNAEEVRAGAQVLNDVLAQHDYLVADRFSVTDIIVGFTVNWARRMQLLDGCDHLQPYLERLFERPHCPLNRA